MDRKNRTPRRFLFLLPVFLLCLLLSPLSLRSEQTQSSVLRGTDTRLSYAVSSLKEKALDGLTAIRKIYRLPHDALAPAPDPEGYGLVHTAEEMLEVFDRASLLLDGREPIFKADTPFDQEKGVRYYCDDSILALVWYQDMKDGNNLDSVVTFGEVFLSDASQFRRKLSDDAFGAGAHKFPTDMALSVNAVLATSGDFYRFRSLGFCVFEGELCRLDAAKVDTCAIDRNGDLLFIPAGTITDEESAKAYIEEHGVDFTLSFGPVMIEDHQPVYTHYYALGEANENYPRFCIAQDGRLHYLFSVIKGCMSVSAFTDFMMETGVERCYALDGGQSGTIVMEGTALNPSMYGYGNDAQRAQSDIIYFASAIPESERGRS